MVRHYFHSRFVFEGIYSEWPPWRQVQAPALTIVIVVLSTGILILAMSRFRVRLTFTDSSCAEGFYRIIDAPIAQGALVEACLPPAIGRLGLARGYLGRGNCPGGAEPVVKLALGFAGDRIEVEPQQVLLNGVSLPNSATAVRDSSGRPLGHVTWGRYRVSQGEVWLFGFNNRKSWDSRYFGPIPERSVRGVVSPLLTW